MLEFSNMSTNQVMSGLEAIRAWDDSYQHHSVPIWFSKAARAYLKSIGVNHRRIQHNGNLPFDLDQYIEPTHQQVFDHWGTIGKGKLRSLVTQPYDECDDKAARVANALGCELHCPRHNGPWHPLSRYFEFRPPQACELKA